MPQASDGGGLDPGVALGMGVAGFGIQLTSRNDRACRWVGLSVKGKKIVEKGSQVFGLRSWKNCVVIDPNGQAGGGTDLVSGEDGEFSDYNNICPALLTGLHVVIYM